VHLGNGRQSLRDLIHLPQVGLDPNDYRSLQSQCHRLGHGHNTDNPFAEQALQALAHRTFCQSQRAGDLNI